MQGQLPPQQPNQNTSSRNSTTSSTTTTASSPTGMSRGSPQRSSGNGMPVKSDLVSILRKTSSLQDFGATNQEPQLQKSQQDRQQQQEQLQPQAQQQHHQQLPPQNKALRPTIGSSSPRSVSNPIHLPPTSPPTLNYSSSTGSIQETAASRAERQQQQQQLPPQPPQAQHHSPAASHEASPQVLSFPRQAPRSNSSRSLGSGAAKLQDSASAEYTPQLDLLRFNSSEIQKSYEQLLRKPQPGAGGASPFTGKSTETQSLSSQSNAAFASAKHLRDPHLYLQPGHGDNHLAHSPVFGSPAVDHGKHWIKSGATSSDHATDSENDANNDLDRDDESEQQQWQIDYDHHISDHVDLDIPGNSSPLGPHLSTSASMPSLRATSPLAGHQAYHSSKIVLPIMGVLQNHRSSLDSAVRPRRSSSSLDEAKGAGAKENGGGGERSRQSSEGSYGRIPTMIVTDQGRHSTEIPVNMSKATMPLPPLPAHAAATDSLPNSPRNSLDGQPRTRQKSAKFAQPVSVFSPAPPTLPSAVLDRRPVSLANPPRRFIHHGKILQVINTSTVKDRYLFLFSDLLLIAKPMSPGHPKMESRFQVKDVIELKKISLSLSREKDDAKDDGKTFTPQRQMPPHLAEFIRNFDHNPTRALNIFIQKRALHPDPAAVAHLLFKTRELSKRQLSQFLTNVANKYVLRSFLDQCQFSGLSLDDSLRIFVEKIQLPERDHAKPKENERISGVDYLLEEFSRRWYEANANVVVYDASIAHKLVVAMIVLNAQLHGNIGIRLVRGREEVGIMVRPRILSQPSTPTLPSIPVMESNTNSYSTGLAAPLTRPISQQELDDLSNFPTPTKDSFADAFQLLDQQRIVPKEVVYSIFSSISQRCIEFSEEQDSEVSLTDENHSNTAPTNRKLLPIMMTPSSLPPRLTLKIPSDSIIVTVPAPNPYLSIQLTGRDIRCEPPILDFGSHRTQRFKIIGTALGKKSLTLKANYAEGKGDATQFYDLSALPSKHSIAVERQFMRHTFQISLLNDLGTRRRYLFGTSSAVEKEGWAKVLRECILEAKGQNASRLNEHTGMEQSIGLQILKELLLGVEASDEDEPKPAVSTASSTTVNGALAASGVVGAANGGSVPVGTDGPAAVSLANRRLSILHPAALSMDTGAAAAVNGTVDPVAAAIARDSWMCKMPRPGAPVPDRLGMELVRLVVQNSLLALMLGFMGALGRNQQQRSEAIRRAQEEQAEEDEEEMYEGADDEYDEEDGDRDSEMEFDSEVEEDYGRINPKFMRAGRMSVERNEKREETVNGEIEQDDTSEQNPKDSVKAVEDDDEEKAFNSEEEEKKSFGSEKRYGFLRGQSFRTLSNSSGSLSPLASLAALGVVTDDVGNQSSLALAAAAMDRAVKGISSSTGATPSRASTQIPPAQEQQQQHLLGQEEMVVVDREELDQEDDDDYVLAKVPLDGIQEGNDSEDDAVVSSVTHVDLKTIKGKEIWWSS